MVDYHDVPPGKPSVIEFEERLAAKNDTIEVVPTGASGCALRCCDQYPPPLRARRGDRQGHELLETLDPGHGDTDP